MNLIPRYSLIFVLKSNEEEYYLILTEASTLAHGFDLN